MATIPGRPCQELRPFLHAPDVCASCGHLATSHCTVEVSPELKAAVWGVLLRHGGLWNYYGGCFEAPAAHSSTDLREHIAQCGLDMERTMMPEMDEWLSYFTDTFDESTHYTTRLCGVPVCRCGRFNIWGVKFGIDDINLGQLIWLTCQEE